MRLVVILIIALFGPGCHRANGSSTDADALGDASPPVACADVAAQLCAHAGSCTSGGQAPVWLSAGGTRIVYMSVAYCTSIFTSQCGPAAPSGDVPLVRDPVACGEALESAECTQGGLLLPVACGGSQ